MSINCRVAKSGEEGTCAVPCVTLDSSLSHIQKIDLLKVDAEGYETRVLKGALTALERTDRVLVEACTESDRKSVESILLARGFRFVTRADDVLYYSRVTMPSASQVELESASPAKPVEVWMTR